MLVVAQHLVHPAEFDDFLEEVEEVGILLQVVPVKPGDFVVLTIGVVVTPLRVSHLVAREHHGNALAGHQHRHGILDLLVAQVVDALIVALTFPAAVPAVVAVLTVAVVLAIGLVVLAVVRHEVHHRKAVVGGDEVHAGLDATVLRGIQVWRADDTLLHIVEHILVALQETPHGITEFSVPFCPASP